MNNRVYMYTVGRKKVATSYGRPA